MHAATTAPATPAWDPLEPGTEWCHVKRFSERWHADAAFRTRMPKAPLATLREYGLRIDAEAVKPMWDGSLLAARLAGQKVDENTLPEPIQAYRRHIRGLLGWRQSLFDAAVPAHPRWRAWRQRQIARARSEMGALWTRGIVFSTATYELSRGCSVGCWFCGVDAPRLSDHFRRSPENGRLFRDVLRTVAGFCGHGGLWSQFLYWASDPFDNPDYEALCEDYFEVAGRYPAVTTALALRNPARTRAWLELAPRKGLPVTRFSVLTLPMLGRLHATFSAEEMASVECILLNDESDLSKANAGRFRARAAGEPELLRHEVEKLQPLGTAAPIDEMALFGPSSIACVSGFLFNLVDRSVRLISPCKASERWPLGYIVFGTGRFQGPDDLAELLQHLIEDAMATELDAAAPVRFRDDVRYELEEHGFRAWTCHAGVRFQDAGRSAYLRDLGNLVATGRHRPDELAQALLERQGVFPVETHATLAAIYDKGYLQDEPRAPSSAVPPAPGTTVASTPAAAQPASTGALASA